MRNFGLRASLAVFTIILLGFTLYEYPANNKKLLYEDATYEEEIRTVLLYPNTGRANDVFSPPVTALGSNNLVLEFDDLVESHEQYRVKIVPCTYDWKPSQVNNLDILYEFNEFNITRYEYSTDTKIAYIHYSFNLPRIKLPGNYLLVAYRGTDEKDIILSKRFMVFNPNLNIQLMSNLMGISSTNRLNQQIDFKITYENYELINPMESVKIVLRQNQQWHNAVTLNRPTFFHEGELEYRFFNYENNFSAGNEYRFFDMRSLRYPGQRVANVDFSTRPTTVNIMPDRPRIYQAYAQYNDLNGDFYIQNQDTGGSSESDYLYTNFTLLANEELGGDIYVVGKMNNYKMDNSTIMEYNPKRKVYTNSQILKQGIYDYKYLVKGDSLNSNYLEGNHFEAENDYEIFVYYKAPNLRGDLLLAYKQITLNNREN
ncbi:DUF5103 domain-containing protein [Fulvivirga lutimaris]|uniref:type IX secretion system plug protein n=1 Tax=Fulvivirga lutimaris TaxID=1819566 RepID=UPI0012BB67FA|nr:DUF5103 domain-containing protein [Fulvivirga lutimaris]MTI40848.1 DUF5103 domain-containing protein [Fulvivirga lutimaris]